jgi:hypothetical protein
MCNISVVCLKLDLKLSYHFLPAVKFLPTYSTYQLKCDRPRGRSESLWHVFSTGFAKATPTSWAGRGLIKPSYSELGQMAEINYHEVDQEGLGLAQPHLDTRSGRYS